MFRTHSGDLVPINFDELDRLILDNNLDAGTCRAVINYSDDDSHHGIYYGFNAKIIGYTYDDGYGSEEFSFNTGGYVDKEDLMLDIEGVGILQIEDET